MNVIDLFRSFHQRPIGYYPIHKAITGRTTTAILFSYILQQLEYYGKGIYYCTDLDITRDTGLSEKEIRTAKDDLKRLGYINIERSGAKGRCHYSLDEIALKSSLNEHLNKSKGAKHTPQPNGIFSSAQKAKQDTLCSAERAEHNPPKGRNSLKEEIIKEENTQSRAPSGAGTVSDPLTRKWHRFAGKLANAISQAKKTKIAQSRITSWGKSIGLIHRVDGIDIERIQEVLLWYCVELQTRHDDRFFTQAYCGDSFRSKFLQIEFSKNKKDKTSSEDGDSQDEAEDQVPTVRSRLATPEEVEAARAADENE